MDISLAILGTGILILIALGSVFVGGLIFFSALFNKRLEEIKENQVRFETEVKANQARFETELKEIKENQVRFETEVKANQARLETKLDQLLARKP